MKQRTYRFLKSLPFILCLVMTPLTLYWICHYNPSFLDIFALEESAKVPDEGEAAALLEAVIQEPPAPREVVTQEPTNLLEWVLQEPPAPEVEPAPFQIRSPEALKIRRPENPLAESPPLETPVEPDPVEYQWETARDRLVQELNRQEGRDLDGIRRRHLRVAMRRNQVIDRLVREEGYWNDRSRLPYYFFVEGDCVADHESMGPFLKGLRRELDRLWIKFLAAHAVSREAFFKEVQVFFIWIFKTRGKFKAVYYSSNQTSYDLAARVLLIETGREGVGALPFSGRQSQIEEAFESMLRDHYGVTGRWAK